MTATGGVYVYWIALSAFYVCVSLIVLDWHRLRELIPAGLAGVVLSGLHLVTEANHSPMLPVNSGAWDRVSVTLLQQAIIAPAVAMWFAQGLTGERGFPLLRTLKFAGMSTMAELLVLLAGRIVYAPTWNVWLSGVFYLAWYSVIWWVQTWVSTYAGAPSNPKAPPQ